MIGLFFVTAVCTTWWYRFECLSSSQYVEKEILSTHDQRTVLTQLTSIIGAATTRGISFCRNLL